MNWKTLLPTGCFILALPGLVSADTISSVSCATPTASLSAGTTSCSATGSYGFANASNSSSVLLPSSASQAAEIDATSSVSALLGTSRAIAAVSTAQSSSNISVNFSTNGPIQNGFLELTFLQTAWTVPGYGSASESLTIGSYSVSPNGQNLVSVFIPIQLGSEFQFTFIDSLLANGDAGTGYTTASIGANISLQAFESDQTTAVQLFDPPNSAGASTPEPGTLGMLGLGTLLAFVGLIRRNRTTTPPSA